MRRFLQPIKYSAMRFWYNASAAVTNTRGDFYVSDAVRIIAAVILGALLLAALVLIFNDTVIPKVTQAITDLFN